MIPFILANWRLIAAGVAVLAVGALLWLFNDWSYDRGYAACWGRVEAERRAFELTAKEAETTRLALEAELLESRLQLRSKIEQRTDHAPAPSILLDALRGLREQSTTTGD